MWVREKKEPQGPEQLYTLKAYLAGHSRDYYRVLEQTVEKLPSREEYPDGGCLAEL